MEEFERIVIMIRNLQNSVKGLLTELDRLKKENEDLRNQLNK